MMMTAVDEKAIPSSPNAVEENSPQPQPQPPSNKAVNSNHIVPPPPTIPDRRSSLLSAKATSHRSFLTSHHYHINGLSHGKTSLFASGKLFRTPSSDEDEALPQDDIVSENGSIASHNSTSKRKQFWHKKRFLSRDGNDDNNNNLHTHNEEQMAAEQQVLQQPDSDVERIVQRLELRNANRVNVPIEVKNRFLRLCKESSIKRRAALLHQLNSSSSSSSSNINVDLGADNGEEETHDERGNIVTTKSHHQVGGDNNISQEENHDTNLLNNESSRETAAETITTEVSLSCILRSDIIQIRKSIRLEVESRPRFRRITDGIKAYFGFRIHSKVLLHVLNRAVDSIDASGISLAAKQRRRRSKGLVDSSFNSNSGPQLTGSGTTSLSHPPISNILEETSYNENDKDMNLNSIEGGGDHTNKTSDIDEKEWFYYKDFAFYSLKVESNYPWMRNATIHALLITFAFYFFTPILWCSILNDENICPRYDYTTGLANKDSGWLSALFFASATMSTVGYGDVTVLQNSANPDIDTGSTTTTSSSDDVETWRIFIATIYMILSLVVSVVGFQAGLDNNFSWIRQRLDIFGRRVYEILRDAGLVKGIHDKHDEIISRMRWSKILQLVEITLIFFILNLVGVLAVQLSLLNEKENEFGEKIYLSWMESFYWSVQTTTTIGYGDVNTPESLRWFLLLYLAISTYFVGSAFGKLGELSKKLESMQLLYLWQQQEPSYEMLRDFSGRPDESANEEGEQDILDFEPEIDQFEFTIASLVVMGKVSSEDVRPILEKFKRLTGEKSNKITTADVSGPIRKKKNEVPQLDEGSDGKDKPNTDTTNNDATLSTKSSGSGALLLGKKIAQAFKEEVLSSSSAINPEKTVVFEEKEKEKPVDFSEFCIPPNTYAIAIDDSKIQRKLLGKIFDNAGIASDRCTICGDGYDEIMGFVDYVVNFINDKKEDYIFMIVDENLDIVHEETKEHDTISGSQCVENIRRRLSPETERRLFALIRSANDSSSDLALYKTRAHAFLPKTVIKKDKMKEILAPLWLARFPPTEFGEDTLTKNNESEGTLSSPADHDIACTGNDIANKLTHIQTLFEKDAHIHQPRLIQDNMHELKGDLLTMHSNIPVHSVVGQINLVQATNSPEILVEKWQTIRVSTNEIIQSLQKNFHVPKNTYAIAIDDSKIQRKLLGKFFDFLSIPPENCIIVGDGYSEIIGFEDLVVNFMQDHKDDYVLMIVDENLDTTDETSNESIFVSGSDCVDKIRKRLAPELEKRMLALVRSANDSTTDISLYKKRAHGFLAKAPIRREKANEIVAPIWMERFPPNEFVDSAGFDIVDEKSVSTAQTDEMASTPYDIAQKLVDIDGLFKKNAHVTDLRLINDQLHELKGDLLTLNLASDLKMIPVLGQINLMLLGNKQPPDAIADKWHALRDRIYSVINSEQQGSEGQQSASRGFFRRQRRASSAALTGSPSHSSKLSHEDSKSFK